MSLVSAVAAVAGLLVLIGTALLVVPSRWARLTVSADPSAVQAMGGALRVLMGLALVYGAESTAFPSAVAAFGTVLVGVGVAILWVDPAAFARWLGAWTRGALVRRLRVGGVLALLAGLSLVASLLLQIPV